MVISLEVVIVSLEVVIISLEVASVSSLTVHGSGTSWVPCCSLYHL